LQAIIFIPVDIFLEKLHNSNRIDGEFEAWLTFLGSDEPRYIIKLIREYPYFMSLYKDLYQMCLNVERVMNMFSEEMKILDRNTVKYMIDELQDELDDTKAELDSAKAEIADKDAAIADKDTTIADQNAIIAELQAKLKELQ
jgi:hypothetical protein